jgi:hypothetical protein
VPTASTLDDFIRANPERFVAALENEFLNNPTGLPKKLGLPPAATLFMASIFTETLKASKDAAARGEKDALSVTTTEALPGGGTRTKTVTTARGFVEALLKGKAEGKTDALALLRAIEEDPAFLAALGFKPTSAPPPVPTPTTPEMPRGPAASMNIARALHTATVLLDGRVLVVGGHTTKTRGEPTMQAGMVTRSTTASRTVSDFALDAELYDPRSNAWTKAGRMKTLDVFGQEVKRSQHTATLLRDGRVLIVGGFGVEGRFLGIAGEDRRPLTTAHVFDPKTSTFTYAGRMAHERHGHTATLLADGKVLVAGGFERGAFLTDGTAAPVEIFDPRTFDAAWGFATPSGLAEDVARALNAVGFVDMERRLSYAWSKPLLASMVQKREGHVAFAVQQGTGASGFSEVFFFGGFRHEWPFGTKLSDRSEVYSSKPVAQGELAKVGNVSIGASLSVGGGLQGLPVSLAKPRRNAGAAALVGERLVIAGGDDMKSPVAEIEVFDAKARTLKTAGKLNVARTNPTVLAIDGGRGALVIGGFVPGKGEVKELEIVNLSGTAKVAGALATPRNGAAAVVLQDGRVLVTGGFTGGTMDVKSRDGQALATCEIAR